MYSWRPWAFETNKMHNTYGDYENIIELEVPGFNKNDIKIKLKNRYVVIRGKTETRKYDNDLFVGDEVSDVKATLKDGLLTIELIKDEDKGKDIPVE